MGAIEAVKFAALPPVRRPVPVRQGTSGAGLSMHRFFGDRPITLYASGTAALAQALARCSARASVSAPEAVIPAYGCPDLVAACVHAAVSPRLVDIASSGWSYDLDELLHTLSNRTVAIVSVNLLGIADETPGLAHLCQRRGITLIQDSAQFLPRQPTGWPGDYVILSFGRGKPMNLLHGGALIEPADAVATPVTHPAVNRFRDRMLNSAPAALAFNFLTRPYPYGIVSRLPGSGLGRVVYEPLQDPSPLPPNNWARVDAAFHQYQQHRSYDRQIWTSALAEWASFGIRPLSPIASPFEPEPLRLTLLAPDRASRDTLLNRLSCAHLGASRLYGTDLTHIAGVPPDVRDQGPFPRAAALADRLFTLPTHSLVTPSIVRQASNCIRDWHRHRRSD